MRLSQTVALLGCAALASALAPPPKSTTTTVDHKATNVTSHTTTTKPGPSPPVKPLFEPAHPATAQNDSLLGLLGDLNDTARPPLHASGAFNNTALGGLGKLNDTIKPTPTNGTGNFLPQPAFSAFQSELAKAEASAQASASAALTGPPPAQTNQNCHGSFFCYGTGDTCKQAASNYDNDTVYTAYTSWTEQRGNIIGLKGCTAIFECDNNNYGVGWTGAQIKEAFFELFSGANGKKCKHCGSSYRTGGCHVTANYCKDCKNVNTGPPFTHPLAAPAA